MHQAEEKYLVTGASGQLGYAVQLALGGEEGQAIPKSREAFDITNGALVESWLPTLRPDAVINCAAYTNIMQAEQHREACWRANALGPHNLAQVCAAHDIPLFHVSTDYVFGQDFSRCMLREEIDWTAPDAYDSQEKRQRMLYRELCPVGPIGFYACSKAAGEHAILNVAAEHPDFHYAIIRTSSLFERPWRAKLNFPMLLARRLLNCSSEPLAAAADVYTNLCYVEHLVPAILWLVRNRNEWIAKNGPAAPKGIYHIANRGTASLYEAANLIRRKLDSPRQVQPTSRVAYAESLRVDPKTIPAFTCLNLDKYHETSGPPMPHWEDALADWCSVARKYLAA